MKQESTLCFNTSHVVIYQFIKTYEGHPIMFQYISCCYLSEDALRGIDASLEFQYISCCYLSGVESETRIGFYMFQYISCCYLSFSCQLYWGQKIVSIHLMLLFIMEVTLVDHLVPKCFNTSHVVIYLLSSILHLFDLGFNTSHVVIYLSCVFHLTCKKAKFQYISCCYLSNQ